MSLIYIGGTRYASNSLWVLNDTGSALSITNSLPTASGDVTAVARAFSGNVYVALGNIIYKYDADLNLDTGWANNGTFDCGAQVNDLALDFREYLAVAQESYGGITCRLIYTSGTNIWNSSTGTSGHGVHFTYDDMEIVFAYQVGPDTKAITLFTRFEGDVVRTYFTHSLAGYSRKGYSNFDGTKIFGIRDRATAGDGIVNSYPFTDGDTADWSTTLGADEVLDMILHDNGFLYICGTVGTDSKTVWKVDATSGAIVASYETGTTARSLSTTDYGTSGNIVVVGDYAENEDSEEVTVSIFDTDLNYQYGLAFDGSVSLYSVAANPEIFSLAASIVDQSTDTAADYLEYVKLSISAIGTPEPDYQWYKNSSPISGATDNILRIKGVTESDGGTYYCTAINIAGSDTSNDIELTINPYIESQPSDTTVDVGASVSLTVVAGGFPGTFTYQWYKNAVLLAGETSSSLVFSLVVKSDWADYSCLVTETGGTGWTETVEVTLTVLDHEAGDRLPAELNREKNAKRSPNAWPLLLEFIFTDGTIYRIVQGKKPILFENHDFLPLNFQCDFVEQSSEGSLTSSTLKISNITFPLEVELQDPDKIVGATVRFIWVNMGNLTADYSEMDITFNIISGSYDWKWISLEVGMPNLLTQSFPEGRYLPEGCESIFKDSDCGYPGIVITGVDISKGIEVIIEIASHTFTTGDAITIEKVNRISPSLTGNYVVTVVDSTHVKLKDTSSTNYTGTYTSGGIIGFRYCRRTLSECRIRENSSRYLAFIGLRSGTGRIV